MKNNKNIKKIYTLLLYVTGGLAICWLVMGAVLLVKKQPSSIYVSSENVKQGETIFIRVKSQASEITGSFGTEKLIFYKKGIYREWIAFLGIDADHNPGDYKIFVDTSDAEHLVKNIKVEIADFTLTSAISAPSAKTGFTNETAINNIINNDNPVLKKVLKKITESPYFKKSFSFPLKKMEKSGLSFGKFINFTKYNIQHLGVDLKAPQKTEIYAINDGKVVSTAELSNYGKTVIIDHGLDIFSLYLHLDEFDVKEGDDVKRGQIIGLSGDTGYATAPHLHFSVRVGASRVDPIAFIETTKRMDDSFVLADITQAFLNLFNSR